MNSTFPKRDWNIAIGDSLPDDADWLKGGDVGPNQIVEGKVLRIDDDFILVDVGYKSEGIIPRNEWEEGERAPRRSAIRSGYSSKTPKTSLPVGKTIAA